MQQNLRLLRNRVQQSGHRIEKVGDKYILYFAMSAMGKPATAGIGIASADSPEGPFTLDTSVDGKGKLFTSSEIDVRNSIDPCYFEDNGQKWWFGVVSTVCML